MMNTMKKATIATLFGATAFFTAAVSVNAATISSPDQKFTLETPDDNWKEIPDQTTKLTLTNGSDYVTVRCYDKEEVLKDLEHVLPMPTVAHDEFEEEFLAYYSTDKDVYVITGLADRKEDINDVRSIVNSIQLADHAKPKAEEKQQEKKEEKKDEIQKTDEMYTLFNEKGKEFIVYKYTDGNYRSEDGTLFQNNGDGDWIDYYGNHYSTTGAVVTAEKTGYSFALRNQAGAVVTVYEYTDGSLRSEDGNLFQDVDGDEYIDYYGNHYNRVEENSESEEGQKQDDNDQNEPEAADTDAE